LREPFPGAAKHVLLEVDAADKQRGVIGLRVEKKRTLIAFACLVEVAADKVGLGGLHRVIDFASLREVGFGPIFRQIQDHLQDLAVVAQFFGFEGDLAGAHTGFLAEFGIGEGSGIRHHTPRPSRPQAGVRGMIHNQFFKQGHGVDKLALQKEVDRLLALGVVFLGLLLGLDLLRVRSLCEGWRTAQG
jgi:hypothetical protein